MRPHRPAVLALPLLLAACRGNPAPAPRPATTPANSPAPSPSPSPGAPGDAGRDPWGLSVTLMSASPPTHPAGADTWTVTLNLMVVNQAPDRLSLSLSQFHVTCDENVRGTTPADGYEGPTSLAPGARAPARLTAVFPASPNPPVTVAFTFDTPRGISNPVSFPLPSLPQPARGR